MTSVFSPVHFKNTWSRCSFGRREGQGQNKARKAAVHPWNPQGSSIFPEIPECHKAGQLRPCGPASDPQTLGEAH